MNYDEEYDGTENCVIENDENLFSMLKNMNSLTKQSSCSNVMMKQGLESRHAHPNLFGVPKVFKLFQFCTLKTQIFH
jgi:hypothetical protein